jgi:hypothetical protein
MCSELTIRKACPRFLSLSDKMMQIRPNLPDPQHFKIAYICQINDNDRTVFHEFGNKVSLSYH